MSDILRTALQNSLGSNFVLGRELGGGGMSRVFVARDQTLNRDIAIKVLTPDLLEGLSVERFAREIQVAAGLQEPHIVPVLTSGSTADGLPFYSMPFIDGENLRARLDRSAVPVSEALSILRDVAKALVYAHSRRIVHRDIKPENILLSNGTAVVTDFGIAKAIEVARTQSPDVQQNAGITRTGMSIGTPAYMAPEQAAGDPAMDQRVDIYAWGVVAYELLSGKHPFAGKTTPQLLMAAHLSETPNSLTVTAGAISSRVVSLVMRCLSKDPNERPVASELVDVLSVTSTADNATRSTRQRFAVGAVLVAMAAFVFVFWMMRRIDAGNAMSGDATSPIMMAVLPFEHLGPADQQPFTDGLTDAVTSKLTGIASLAVIDRRSAATYRGTTKRAKQIGAELGVRYLLEGVVRWAKDGAGVWKATVTPTLTDVSTGTAKWSGDPLQLTLDDPFTAQGKIAADVARAMEVAVLPAEQSRLNRNYTNDPQAFASFQRALAIRADARRKLAFAEPSTRLRAISELEHAITLDSNFVEAWARLASERVALMTIFPDDTILRENARKAVAQAYQRGERSGDALISKAWFELEIGTNGQAVNALVTRAIAAAPNDADILNRATSIAVNQNVDSIADLAARAAKMDPRSTPVLFTASFTAVRSRNRAAALRYADAILAIDSLDEQGWLARIVTRIDQGDTLLIALEINRAFACLQKPSLAMLSQMPYAGGALADRFVRSSLNDLGVTQLTDTVAYFDAKADVFLRRGDRVRSRAYSDSIIALIGERSLSAGAQNWFNLQVLAFAQANTGRLEESRRTLRNLLSMAVPVSLDGLPTEYLSYGYVAGTYALLGEPETAMKWLEAERVHPPRIELPLAYGLNAKLFALRGNAAFERFLKAHSE